MTADRDDEPTFDADKAMNIRRIGPSPEPAAPAEPVSDPGSADYSPVQAP